jgi:hypothetical protein
VSKLSYDLKTAAAATDLSRSTLDRAIRAGLLKARRSDSNDRETGKGRGKVVILAADLQAYLDALTEA